MHILMYTFIYIYIYMYMLPEILGTIAAISVLGNVILFMERKTSQIETPQKETSQSKPPRIKWKPSKTKKSSEQNDKKPMTMSLSDWHDGGSRKLCVKDNKTRHLRKKLPDRAHRRSRKSTK